MTKSGVLMALCLLTLAANFIGISGFQRSAAEVVATKFTLVDSRGKEVAILMTWNGEPFLELKGRDQDTNSEYRAVLQPRKLRIEETRRGSRCYAEIAAGPFVDSTPAIQLCADDVAAYIGVSRLQKAAKLEFTGSDDLRRVVLSSYIGAEFPRKGVRSERGPGLVILDEQGKKVHCFPDRSSSK